MSLTRFFVLTGGYILVLGGVSGGIAAWVTRSGSSPMGHVVSAFRSRAGSNER